MYIDNMSYVVRVADGAVIPKDLRNRDYREFVKWENAGNVALPPQPSEAHELVNGAWVENAAKASEIAREALQEELATLEMATARATLWLIKILIQKNVLRLQDIPQQLINYKNRIEEIQAELGQ